jgi:hypothetical protein
MNRLAPQLWAFALAIIGTVLGFILILLSGLAAQIVSAIMLAIVAALLILAVWWAIAFVKVKSDRVKFAIYCVYLAVPITPLLTTVSRYHLVDWTGLEIVAAVSAVLAVMVLIWAPRYKPPKTPIAYMLFVMIFAALFGWVAAATINCLYDGGPSHNYQARIKDKYTTTGRSGSTLHLVVAPFGPVRTDKTFEVFDQTYDAA